MSLKLLTAVAPLQPYPRLGKAVSEFCEALPDDQKHRFRALQAQGPPKITDVFRLAEEINASAAGRGSASSTRGTQIHHALTYFQALTTAGDVLVGGSQHMIASGVWAALRVSLVLTTTHLSLLEKIANLLMRVGRDASTRLDMLSLFPGDKILESFIIECLIVVTDLCRLLISYRTQSAAARFLGATNIDKKLRGYEDSLCAWGVVINNRVLRQIAEVSVQNKTQMSMTQKTQELLSSSRRAQRNRRECLALVMALFPEQDEFDRAFRRQRRKGKVKWILHSEEYIAWSQSVNPPSTFLGLEGGFLSGKTVAMANMANHLMQRGDTAVASVFCERSNLKTLDPELLLACLVRQIANRIITASPIRDSDITHLSSLLRRAIDTKSKTAMGLLLSHVIKTGIFIGITHFFILVDGLEYLSTKDASYLATALTSWIMPVYPSLRVSISVTSKSRYQTILSVLNKHSLWLKLSKDKANAELEEFVKAELESRPGFQELRERTRRRLQQTIAEMAEGLYLWASLQIDYLYPKYVQTTTLSETRLLALIDNLPHPLPRLFDAALTSISHVDHQPMVFQIVMASRRPLKLSELLLALSVRPREDNRAKQSWIREHIPDWGNNPASVLYDCSGGLLELYDEDESVHFVHNSVVHHLGNSDKDWTLVRLQNPKLHFGEADWNMSELSCDLYLGRVCLEYLHLPILQRELVEKDSNRVPELSVAALATMVDTLGNTSTLMRTAAHVSRLISPLRVEARRLDLLKIANDLAGENRERSETSLVSRWAASEPSAFLDYASKHWLEHCDHYLSDLLVESAEDIFSKQFHQALHGKCFGSPLVPPAVVSGLQFCAETVTSVTSLTTHSSDIANVLEWLINHPHLRLFWIILKAVYRWVRIADGGPMAFQGGLEILQERLSGYEFDYNSIQLKVGDWTLFNDIPFVILYYDSRVSTLYNDTPKIESNHHEFPTLSSRVGNLLETLSSQFLKPNRGLDGLMNWRLSWLSDTSRRTSEGSRRLLADLGCCFPTRPDTETHNNSQLGMHTDSPLHSTLSTELQAFLEDFNCRRPRDIMICQHLQPIAYQWWSQARQGPLNEEKGIILKLLFLRAAAIGLNLPIPCHLLILNRHTPLYLMLTSLWNEGVTPWPTRSDIERGWFHCHNCSWRAHPPGTAAIAVGLGLYTLTKTMAKAGPINNELFFGTENYVVVSASNIQSKGLISPTDLSQDTRNLVSKLNAAGTDIDWGWLAAPGVYAPSYSREGDVVLFKRQDKAACIKFGEKGKVTLTDWTELTWSKIPSEPFDLSGHGFQEEAEPG